MGKTKLIKVIALNVISFLFPLTIEAAPIGLELPNLKLDPQSVTISGTSSGAMMAIQMQVAHSLTISGIAVFAGGPYYCAKGNFKLAQDPCMKNPQSVDLGPLIDSMKALAKVNSIDDPNNLANKKLLIFSGNRDSIVRMEASYRLKEQLEAFQAKPIIRTDLAAEHGFPTESYGNECDKLGKPWLQKCGFDGAQWTLSGLYGNLNSKGKMSRANLQAFDQLKYGKLEATLDDFGQIYIPASCRQSANPHCRLHLALHGCAMGPEFVEDQFIMNNELNNWAEANQIVVLYPAARSSKLNPHGCWDWFGYTGEDYATKNGKQVKALKQMIDDLLK